MTDSEIITRYRKDNDKQWVGMLYERHAHLVLGLCYKYLGNKAQAEDATCDIFYSLFEKLKKHEVEYFKAWLYTTSRNHCLMSIRAGKNGKLTGLNGHEPESDDSVLFGIKVKEVQLDLLESKLTDLKPEQVLCIRHFYLDGKSYAQISKESGIDLKKVKSHIQNGKRNLKILLEQHKEFNGSQ